jgi:hypothetical protein
VPPLCFIQEVMQFIADDHPLRAIRLRDNGLPRVAPVDLDVRVFLAEALQAQRRIGPGIPVHDVQ